MSDEPRLLELILRFEELRDAGENVSPEALCRDCPELLPALRARLATLQAMDAVLSVEDASPAIVHEPERTKFPEIPGYEILRELGRGGMGVVYEARQTSSGQIVALKMLQADRSATSSQQARFRTEIEAIARLEHPNVVRVFEIGHYGRQPFYTMEYLTGGTLEDKIAFRPQPRESAELLELLARATHAAHQRGIIHRDLNPANILLDADGVPKISDFGLAKRVGSGARLTRTLQVMGTPHYMAPEQATGRSREAGPATDIYSLGAILYRLLTGQPPFVGRSVMEIVMKAAEARPAPPRELVADVPADLEAICLRCLQKRPGSRYPSAAALADDLRRFLDGQPLPAPSIGERVARWFRAGG